MSWSLQVSNGDLALSGSKLATVTNEAKLAQDLRHWLLTHMGDNKWHLGYGSLIDGGTKPTGQYVPSPIGDTRWNVIRANIDADIYRIAAEYQDEQLNRAKADKTRFRKTTLTAGEILVEISSITYTQVADAMNIRVNFNTGTGSNFNIEIPVQGVFTR